MKRKPKSGSGVWQYLEQTGVLEGTAEEIEEARKRYWKEYKKRYKAEHHKTYSVLLSEVEFKQLVRAAEKHHAAPTSFLRQAAFAYMNQTFVVPDAEAVAEIRLLLARKYFCLQQMVEAGSVRITDAERLLEQMSRLEQEVLARLLRPPVFEDYVRSVLAIHAEYVPALLSMIEAMKL